MSFKLWIKQQVHNAVNSIAFIPTIVILFFLLLSGGMLYLDYSETGQSIKEAAQWIRLKDPSTARTIVSVIAAGLISLTVFSFSMVMVVLNQAASQLSNRVLNKLVGNRFQQFVIGFYIGVIIYSLFLLTSIRDTESGTDVPALSTYLLIVLSVIAIFMFVLFLRYITQSIKYRTIIRRIFSQTDKLLRNAGNLSEKAEPAPLLKGVPVRAKRAGLFENFEQGVLLNIAAETGYIILFPHSKGTFVLEQTPVAEIIGPEPLPEGLEERILSQITIVNDPTDQANYYYGLKQLSEIAIKALSPGINDPGTAVESLQALFTLLAYRLRFEPENVIRNKNGQIGIVTSEKKFDTLVAHYILPIWDYGHSDRNIYNEMKWLLEQLLLSGKSAAAVNLLEQIRHKPFTPS